MSPIEGSKLIPDNLPPEISRKAEAFAALRRTTDIFVERGKRVLGSRQAYLLTGHNAFSDIIGLIEVTKIWGWRKKQIFLQPMIDYGFNPGGVLITADGAIHSLYRNEKYEVLFVVANSEETRNKKRFLLMEGLAPKTALLPIGKSIWLQDGERVKAAVHRIRHSTDLTVMEDFTKGLLRTLAEAPRLVTGEYTF